MTVAISAGQFPRSLLRRGVTSNPVVTVGVSGGFDQAGHLWEKFSSLSKPEVENLMLPAEFQLPVAFDLTATSCLL